MSACACGDRYCNAGCGEPIACEGCGQRAPKAKHCGLDLCQPCADRMWGARSPGAEREGEYIRRSDREAREAERSRRLAEDARILPRPPDGMRWHEPLRGGRSPFDPYFTRYPIGCELRRGTKVLGRLIPWGRVWRWLADGGKPWAPGMRGSGSLWRDGLTKPEAAAALLAAVTGRIEATGPRVAVELEVEGHAEEAAEAEALAIGEAAEKGARRA